MVTWQHEEGKFLTAQQAGNVLWRFHYDPQLPKPFFDPVALRGKRSLTWNRPPDHHWHHGLWFSWKFLNGENYWEPNPQTGQCDGRTRWDQVRIRTQPDGRARIDMRLRYGSAGQPLVLAEQRRVEVSAVRPNNSYWFDWTCTFTAGPQDVVLDRTPLPGEPDGKAYGGYAGLSVRLARDLTEREAATDAGPVQFSPQARFRGKARVMDYNGLLHGQAVGIAICDHPDNVNHPTPWYAIRSQVMSYFSPAVLCYGPHPLAAGEQMTLRYRVIVHAGRWDAAALTEQYREYAAQ
jgi:hypothetical protein